MELLKESNVAHAVKNLAEFKEKQLGYMAPSHSNLNFIRVLEYGYACTMSNPVTSLKGIEYQSAV